MGVPSFGSQWKKSLMRPNAIDGSICVVSSGLTHNPPGNVVSRRQWHRHIDFPVLTWVLINFDPQCYCLLMSPPSCYSNFNTSTSLSISGDCIFNIDDSGQLKLQILHPTGSLTAARRAHADPAVRHLLLLTYVAVTVACVDHQKVFSGLMGRQSRILFPGRRSEICLFLGHFQICGCLS